MKLKHETSNLTNIDNTVLFPIGRPTVLPVLYLHRLMVCQNIHSVCRLLWFNLKSGLFCLRLAPTLLCNSTNINMQLLFSMGHPNCIWGVGECVTKENPKSDLDLGLRGCQNLFHFGEKSIKNIIIHRLEPRQTLRTLI